MRQPTEQEVREIDVAHTEGAIAKHEHDLFVIDVREKHGVVGQNNGVPLGDLSGEDRAELVRLEAKATRLGTQAALAVEKLRSVCGVSKDAMLVDGVWRSPVTKRPYGEPERKPPERKS